MPGPGYALERLFPPVCELDARASDEVADGAGHKHLSSTGCAGDPLCEVYGDPGNIITAHLDLARVEPDTNFDLQRLHRIPDGACALHRPPRAIERRDEAVPNGVDLPASEALQLAADHGVMGVEERTPCPVPQSGCALRRPHDVGEQHSGQH